MKNKIDAAFITVCIVIFMSILVIVMMSHGTGNKIYGTGNKKEDNSGVFVEIEGHLSYDIVYDKDTRVIYAKSNSGAITFCPLYNADGTLKLYGENNDE